ncbi:MAG: DUF2059 domain-containing protein [Candidatus Brocadiia bacterium]|jgi:hypothetical protein
MRCALTALLLACLLGAGSKPVFAQEDAKAKAHLAAATELFQAMQLDKTVAQTIDSVIEAQIKGNPQLAPYRSVMQDFLRKYMGWDGIKDEMAQLYMDEFTTEELRDITAFYKTPTGQKMALRLPTLTTKGAAIGQQRVQEHMGELQEMIAKKKAELGDK